MKLPIITVEHGDVSVFKSADDLQQYLEPIDVINGEYQAYDREGYLLDLKVIDTECPSLLGTIKTKKVIVVNANEKKNHSDELKNIFIDFFRSTSTYEPDDEKQTLDKLINKAINAFGYTS